ncbi:MAG: tetratricopeptide repeat protein, partial [Bacteroidales bacterium]|nr:tetratricopeptide repeat protein [Bacteroidales bacterium]
NYLLDFYKKLAKDKKSLVKLDATKDIKFNIRAHGEDWDGFVKAVEASDMKDKNVILNVVKSQPNVARREEEIKNMSLVYKEIEEDILPPLRRTHMKAWIYDPMKSDAEILNFGLTDPTQLTQKELLYAATLTDDLGEKEKILKKYIELYPDDCKGYNNLAWVYMKQDKLDDAKKMLEKAEGLCPNNPVVLNNFGAYYSKIGDYTKAETYFTKAKQYGAPVGYNMGIIQAAQCKWDQALASFAGSKCTYNIAMVKFQKGDYKGAENELNCAETSTKVDYLKAVIGARTENTQMVIDNLAKAVKESDKCKKMAAADREFIKFWEDPNFQALIK